MADMHRVATSLALVVACLVPTACSESDPSATTSPSSVAPEVAVDSGSQDDRPSVPVPMEPAPPPVAAAPDVAAGPGSLEDLSSVPVPLVLDPSAAPSAEAEAKIERFIETKVIAGWSVRRTPHHLVVHDDDVDERLVEHVVRGVEALRANVFVPTFPPAQPIEAITIVRICESRQQFMAYGAPGGSAGYYAPHHEEVVLYQDRNSKKDTLRVAYSVTCEAYLHCALDGMAAHDWFTLGYGDYYAGHDHKAGEFTRHPFAWRTATAADAKARWAKGIRRFRPTPGEPAAAPPAEGDERERLGLAEWLTWSRSQYDGRNDFEWSRGRDGKPRSIPGAVNAALGWSFIYFLRTSDDPAHARILTRYWETLTGLVRAKREAAATSSEDAAADTADLPERSRWLPLALEAALEGVDVANLEKDWLAHTWVD